MQRKIVDFLFCQFAKKGLIFLLDALISKSEKNRKEANRKQKEKRNCT